MWMVEIGQMALEKLIPTFVQIVKNNLELKQNLVIFCNIDVYMSIKYKK